MYKFLKSVFSSLCLCMQIMMKKTNYVMLLLCKMTLCLNPLWTSHFKVILRRKG